MSLWKLEQVMREEIAEACKPIVAAIEAKYAPLIAEAKAADEKRHQDLREKQMQDALKNALWPVGTKLVEWSNVHCPHRWSKPISVPWGKTGRVGYYEIYDERSSAHVVSPPFHGAPFVRLEKKDGNPGSKRERHVVWSYWFPEGEHPDTYKHPAKEKKALIL